MCAYAYTLHHEMKAVLSHGSALQGYTGPEKTGGNEMSFVTNHTPDAGSINRPINQQSIPLPLCYGCPRCNTLHHNMCIYLLCFVRLMFCIAVHVNFVRSIVIRA